MISKNIKLSITRILVFILVSGLLSCSSDKQEAKKNSPIIKKTYEPNAFERARKYADENPIFSLGKPKKNDNLAIGTSNILWRASLETLDFMPLANADFNGGVIITDWYSTETSKNETIETNKNESIKISVQFVSYELARNSIVVKGFKKNCNNNGGSCKISRITKETESDIENKIFDKARNLNLNLEKNKNK